MKQQLNDNGLNYIEIPIRCDNTSAICLTKNPILHSRTKHIDVKHHFIREHVENNDICLEYVKSEDQIADIFTKPLSTESFFKIRKEMGMMNVDT